MSIEKMYFVNMSGPLKELDGFVLSHVIPNEIQLVKALSILESVKGLFPFNDENPYKVIMEKLDSIGIKPDHDIEDAHLLNKSIDLEGVEKRLEQFEEKVGHIRTSRDELIALRDEKEAIRRQIEPIKNLNIEVDVLFEFKHMKFRFGKMPLDSFERLQAYIENLDVVVYEAYRERKEVFLVYFTPGVHRETIDSLFASLYFTRIRISDTVKGYPKAALATVVEEIKVLDAQILDLVQQLDAYFDAHREDLSELYRIIENLDQVFDVRRYAAQSQDAFFLTGWIAASRLSEFESAMKKAPLFTQLIEEDEAVKRITPPTKLNNHRFFKPFEMLVTMYGVPTYNEMDPTIFVGLTFILMFGLMFGDVGQGFVFALIGYFIYKKTASRAGILMLYLGIFSMMTGLVYGSVFANEHLLRDLFPNIGFINAMESENMLLVLGGAILLGIVIMLMAMVFNMINAYRNKNIGKLLFDKNGLVGLVFYLAVLGIGLSIILPGGNIGITPIVVIIIISLVVIFLSHPLQNLVEKKRHIFPEEKGGFFVESFFEVFELVLAVLSNTISFVRIGAFAMNHVGFALAFEILSRMVGGGGSIVVLILGNIVIMALEGMIVVIQTMRLEYYEIFSRFYDGNGTAFTPFKVTHHL